MSYDLDTEELTEFLYWKSSAQTRRIRELIIEEIKENEDKIKSGSLLSIEDGNKLAREYARNLGRIEGLKFIERLFQYDRQEGSGDNE